MKKLIKPRTYVYLPDYNTGKKVKTSLSSLKPSSREALKRPIKSLFPKRINLSHPKSFKPHFVKPAKSITSQHKYTKGFIKRNYREQRDLFNAYRTNRQHGRSIWTSIKNALNLWG